MRPPTMPDPIGSLADCRFNFLTDKTIDEDKQWKLMLEYFKKNPQALMDAIPTPPGEEEDDFVLDGFHTGLTPKRNFQFRFGHMDPSGALDASFINQPRRPSSSTHGTPLRKPAGFQHHTPRSNSARPYGNRPDSARSSTSSLRADKSNQIA